MLHCCHNHTGVCPSCGYCPCCGRANWPHVRPWVQPWCPPYKVVVERTYIRCGTPGLGEFISNM